TEPDSLRLGEHIWKFRRRGTIPHSKLMVEDNGIGLPFHQNMLEKGIPVEGVHVHRDKMARSVTASIRIRSEQIFFPAPGTVDWYFDFEQELVKFPGGDHDDSVDMMCIAANGIFDLTNRITGHASVDNNHPSRQTHREKTADLAH